MTLVANNNFTSGDIDLTDIILVTPQEKEIKSNDINIHIGAKSTALLSIGYFGFKNKDEAKIVVDLTNPADEITLVQFDLRLPLGLSLKQDGDDYVYELTGDRTTSRKHSIDANRVGDIVRFILLSSSNAVFKGSDGAIFEMTLVADQNFNEGSIVSLENILLVTPEEKEIKPENYQYNVVRKGGDANFDGKVDIADVVSVLNVMATGENSSIFIDADVNFDGKVDIADIVSILNVMANY